MSTFICAFSIASIAFIIIGNTVEYYTSTNKKKSTPKEDDEHMYV